MSDIPTNDQEFRLFVVQKLTKVETLMTELIGNGNLMTIAPTCVSASPMH